MGTEKHTKIKTSKLKNRREMSKGILLSQCLVVIDHRSTYVCMVPTDVFMHVYARALIFTSKSQG